MIKSLFRTLLFWGYTLKCITSPGQTLLQGQLEKKIDLLVNERLPKIAPGGVVLVATGSNIKYYKAFGYSDLETKSKLDKEAIFRIGSITKPFTALGILLLENENKLRLQDTIQQYIPDFPVKDYPISIEHLLTQTSGIKNYFEIDNPAKQKDRYTPREGIAYFQDEPLQF